MKLLTILLAIPSVYGFFSSSATTFDDKLKVPGENPLTFCEDPADNNHLLRITSVDLTPNPPQGGKTLSIKAKGNVTKVIEDGAYVKLEVKVGLIKLISREEDVCEQMKQVNKTCPLQEGEIEITRDVEMPAYIPAAIFTVTADAYSNDDERITCLKAVVDFRKKTSTAEEKEKIAAGGQVPLDDKDSIDL